jgi:hypothetical protein
MNRQEYERLGDLKKKMGISERKLHAGYPRYYTQETFLGSLGGIYDLYWGMDYGSPVVGYYCSPIDYRFLHVPECCDDPPRTFKIYSKRHSWYLPTLKLAKKNGLYTGKFV